MLNQYYAPSDAATAAYLTDVCEYLAGQGHEVHVISSKRNYSNPNEHYLAYEHRKGVHVHRVWSTGFGRSHLFGRLVDYVSFSLAVLFKGWQLGPKDQVWTLSTPPWLGILGRWIASKSRAKHVFWVMDIYPNIAVALGVIRKHSWIDRLSRSLTNKIVQHADQVITLDDAMAATLQRYQPKRLVVQKLWADEHRFKPHSHSSNPLRTEWRLQEKFVVAYSGNLGEAHDSATMIEVMKQLKHHPSIQFCFVGGGAGMERLKKRVQGLGLPVSFYPYQPESSLPESLSAANLHWISMHASAAGLISPSKLYAILAVGRPVLYIGPESGEVFRAVSEAKFGAAFKNQEGERIAKWIEELQEKPEQATMLGQHARSYFELNYKKTKAMESFSRLVADIGTPQD